MVRTNVVILTVVLVGIACGVSTITSVSEIPELEERGLYLHYWLDKEEYLPGEPIFLHQEVENRGNQLTYYRDEEIQEFLVLDASGERLPIAMPWGIVEYIEDEFVPGKGNNVWHPLEAGSAGAQWIVPVLHRFGHSGMAVMLGLSYLEPGSYSVANALLPSDTVSFNVVEPDDPVDSSACKSFLQAAQRQARQKDRESYLRFIEEFVEKYPRTVWTPRVLTQLIASRSVQATREGDSAAHEYALRLLVGFPDYGYAHSALNSLALDELDAADTGQLIQALKRMKQAPHTQSIKKIADSLLQRLGAENQR